VSHVKVDGAPRLLTVSWPASATVSADPATPDFWHRPTTDPVARSPRAAFSPPSAAPPLPKRCASVTRQDVLDSTSEQRLGVV
jgi:hypothetical protein